MLAHRKLVASSASRVTKPAPSGRGRVRGWHLASQVAMAMAMLGSEATVPPPPRAPAPAPASGVMQVKYYNEDSTVFIDNEYLIKGVAGGILWRLLNAYRDEQRTEFSNKEIRLDQSLELPDIKDNLEARLILLRKRLEERSGDLRIEKTARGRFRLVVEKPSLVESQQPAALSNGQPYSTTSSANSGPATPASSPQ
jgi:hypothetical protein